MGEFPINESKLIRVCKRNTHNCFISIPSFSNMFARRILNPSKSFAKSATATTRRNKATDAVSSGLYNNVWMKSTPLYIGYIFAGAVVVEFFFGHITNAVFNVVNRGVSHEMW